MSSSTWGVIRRELGFKYWDSIQTAQSRLSEKRKRNKLNEASKHKKDAWKCDLTK